MLIALGSSGLHSNGYSLVRHVLLERGGLALDSDPGRGSAAAPWATSCSTPTRIYALDCLALAAECGAHAFAHITGGGLAGNLARVLPDGVRAVVDRATWAPQPIFDLIARTGDVARADLELTFNLGVGMVAVVPAARTGAALQLLAARGVPAWPLGQLEPAIERQPGPRVKLVGDYAGTGVHVALACHDAISPMWQEMDGSRVKSA